MPLERTRCESLRSAPVDATCSGFWRVPPHAEQANLWNGSALRPWRTVVGEVRRLDAKHVEPGASSTAIDQQLDEAIPNRIDQADSKVA